MEKFGGGNLKLPEVLAPAIELAEQGYPISELAARFWEESVGVLRGGGRAELQKVPGVGEVVTMPGLARVMRKVASEGKRGFYEGEVAERIMEAVKAEGGLLGMEDLERMVREGGEVVEPCSVEYAGRRVWECPPNGQGIVALMALGVLEILEEEGKVKMGKEGWEHNGAEYLHAVIETLRIAFSDGHWWVADGASPTGLLEKVPYLRNPVVYSLTGS